MFIWISHSEPDIYGATIVKYYKAQCNNTIIGKWFYAIIPVILKTKK